MTIDVINEVSPAEQRTVSADAVTAELAEIDKKIEALENECNALSTEQKSLSVAIADQWGKNTEKLETRYGQIAAKLAAADIVRARLLNDRQTVSDKVYNTEIAVLEQESTAADRAYQSAVRHAEEIFKQFQDAQTVAQSRLGDVQVIGKNIADIKDRRYRATHQ